MNERLKNTSKIKTIVICHNIRSAFNIGSIFRTADGAGVSKIILGGYSAYPPHPKIAKTALGAQNFIPYERIWQTWRVIENLKKDGYHIIALEKIKEARLRSARRGASARQAKNIFQYKSKRPLVLVMGNEVRGLSKEILKRCDETIFIPMRGKKESLNVSVAFGIAIYQITNN